MQPRKRKFYNSTVSNFKIISQNYLKYVEDSQFFSWLTLSCETQAKLHKTLDQSSGSQPVSRHFTLLFLFLNAFADFFPQKLCCFWFASNFLMQNLLPTKRL